MATSEGKRAEVQNEIQILEPQVEPKHLIKDPYILEFLGLKEDKAYLEHELEQGLIDNLQKFLLELGRGFCFVLIDLKTHKLTYQDIGQIDFYVKCFEENIKMEGNNPTIGIALCSEKNETMVEYSVLNENDHIYSKFHLYFYFEILYPYL